jgi:hypothetical protein
MRCEKPHTRRWVAKFSSGYCGVNKWMYRWKQRKSAEGPRCNEPLEDVDHLWRCQGTESPQKWEDALAVLSLEMRRLQTDPILEKIIMGQLRTWQKSATPMDFPTLPAQYKEVVAHQDNQGWINFWIGLPSMGWQEIQDAHYKRIASSKTGSRQVLMPNASPPTFERNMNWVHHPEKCAGFSGYHSGHCCGATSIIKLTGSTELLSTGPGHIERILLFAAHKHAWLPSWDVDNPNLQRQQGIQPISSPTYFLPYPCPRWGTIHSPGPYYTTTHPVRADTEPQCRSSGKCLAT